jgi:hypothetical protein
MVKSAKGQTELKIELADVHLPVQKRLRMEGRLRKARDHVQASTVKIAKAAAVISKTKPTKPRNPEEVSKDQWKKWRTQAPRPRHPVKRKFECYSLEVNNLPSIS